MSHSTYQLRAYHKWKDNKRLLDAHEQLAGRVHTRFSTDTPADHVDRVAKQKNSKARRYSTHEIVIMVRTAWAKKWNSREAAEEFKVPRETMNSWMRLTRLPKTGRLTFPIMLKMVQHARILYVRKFDLRPIYCLMEAARQAGLNWSSVKVFLHNEAVPTIVGFPLYADPVVQARCESYGRGERISGCVLYDPVLGLKIPGGPAPRPIAPAPMLDPRSPEAKTARFLAARAKAGMKPLQQVVAGGR